MVSVTYVLVNNAAKLFWDWLLGILQNYFAWSFVHLFDAFRLSSAKQVRGPSAILYCDIFFFSFKASILFLGGGGGDELSKLMQPFDVVFPLVAGPCN